MTAEAPSRIGSGDFDTVVPADQADNILTRITEAAWDPDGDHPGISALDVMQRNVTNLEATGIIEIDGVEHSFHIADGNNNGTEILGWNQDAEIDRTPPIPAALVPHRDRTQQAVLAGRAAQLLEQWNADLVPGTERGDALHDLLSKRAYDRFFAPGRRGIDFDGIADAHGYVIEDEPTARAARKILHFHAQVPAPTSASTDGETPLETLRRWNDALDTGTDLGAGIDEIRKASARRLSKTRETAASPEEGRALQDLGFRFVAPGVARQARLKMLLEVHSIEAVEHFDPATLPENPVAELFHALDPGLVRTTKVDPLWEASRVVVQACDTLSWGTQIDLPQDTHASLARYGYRVKGPATEIEDAPVYEPDDGPGM